MADFACGTGGFLTSWLKELHKQVKATEDEAAFSNSIYGIEKKQFPYMLCITNLLLHNLDNPRVYHDNTPQPMPWSPLPAPCRCRPSAR